MGQATNRLTFLFNGIEWVTNNNNKPYPIFVLMDKTVLRFTQYLDDEWRLWRAELHDGTIFTDWSLWDENNFKKVYTSYNPVNRVGVSNTQVVSRAAAWRNFVHDYKKVGPFIQVDDFGNVDMFDEYGFKYRTNKADGGVVVYHVDINVNDWPEHRRVARTLSAKYFTGKRFTNQEIAEMPVVDIIMLYYNLDKWEKNGDCPEFIPNEIVNPHDGDELMTNEARFIELDLRDRIYKIRTDLHEVVNPKTGEVIIGLIDPSRLPDKGGLECDQSLGEKIGIGVATAIAGLIPGVGLAIMAAQTAKSVSDAIDATKQMKEYSNAAYAATEGAKSLYLNDLLGQKTNGRLTYTDFINYGPAIPKVGTKSDGITTLGSLPSVFQFKPLVSQKTEKLTEDIEKPKIKDNGSLLSLVIGAYLATKL